MTAFRSTRRIATPLLVTAALVLLAGCTSTPAPAITSAPQTPAVRQASPAAFASLMEKVSQGRAKFLKTFPGHAGLVGILYRGVSGQKHVAWATTDAQVLLPSPALSRSGVNLNQEALHRYADNLTASAAWRRLTTDASVHSITVGRRGPHLIAMVDPNCIFCHLLYKRIMPLVRAGKVRVTFVMVAILKPSSLGKAATILADRDPAAAYRHDETDFDRKTEEGGVVPRPAALLAWGPTVRANTAILQAMGPAATPTLLACLGTVGQPTILRGLPRDLDAFVAHLDPAPSAVCNRGP